MQGKFKFNKYKELADSGMTAEEARKKYVEKFNEMKEKHGLKE
jgi:diazepam-binding inhibitor (GABA receptor modulating acyl-CoA-binding protein)